MNRPARASGIKVEARRPGSARISSRGFSPVSAHVSATRPATGPAGQEAMSRHVLTWRPAPHAHRLATVALVSLLAAIAFQHPAPLLIAAPLLAVLASGRSAARPDDIELRVTVTPRRCFESDEVEVLVTAVLAHPVDEIILELPPAGPVRLGTGDQRQGRSATGRVQARWMLRPDRWGRYRLGPVHVGCRHGHRTWQAVLDISLGELAVFPRGHRTRPGLVPPELPRWIGEHASRAEGAGVEFAGVRPYTAGDRLRDVNWKASGHRGRLHVTTRAAERQADVVVVVDGRSDAGPPGESVLDAAMRGAATVAAAYLRRGDRVGAVGLGGYVRWLPPGLGERQFYRIAEALLDVRRFSSELPPDITGVPRVALPPRALAVVFSPLLDPGAIDAIVDLRRRGNPVLVVDVLDAEPPVSPRSRTEPLALRLWRLDRVALRRDLAGAGIAVVDGRGDGALAAALRPGVRLPASGSRR